MPRLKLCPCTPCLPKAESVLQPPPRSSGGQRGPGVTTTWSSGVSETSFLQSLARAHQLGHLLRARPGPSSALESAGQAVPGGGSLRLAQVTGSGDVGPLSEPHPPPSACSPASSWLGAAAALARPSRPRSGTLGPLPPLSPFELQKDRAGAPRGPCRTPGPAARDASCVHRPPEGGTNERGAALGGSSLPAAPLGPDPAGALGPAGKLPVLLSASALTLQLFDIRPIWSRNALKANISVHPDKLKILLPFVAYYMVRVHPPPPGFLPGSSRSRRPLGGSLPPLLRPSPVTRRPHWGDCGIQD